MNGSKPRLARFTSQNLLKVYKKFTKCLKVFACHAERLQTLVWGMFGLIAIWGSTVQLSAFAFTQLLQSCAYIASLARIPQLTRMKRAVPPRLLWCCHTVWRTKSTLNGIKPVEACCVSWTTNITYGIIWSQLRPLSFTSLCSIRFNINRSHMLM